MRNIRESSRNNKGQEVLEFVLLLALGAVVSIAVILLLGEKLSDFFNTFNANRLAFGAKALTTNTSVINSTSTSGETSNSTPTKSCNNGECVISFGNFKLYGIPQDFNDFVETTGVSGGTFKVSNLMDQIAAQLEQEGKAQESESIKRLASVSHNIAVIETEIEEAVKNCASTTSTVKKQDACLQNFINTAPLKLVGYDDTYVPRPNVNYRQLLDTIEVVGVMASDLDTEYANYANQDLDYTYDPLHLEFGKNLKDILSSINIDDSTKGIVNQLAWDIGMIGTDFHDQTDIDPVHPQATTASLSTYNAGVITHFDASLICAAGNYQDSGQRCN